MSLFMFSEKITDLKSAHVVEASDHKVTLYTSINGNSVTVKVEFSLTNDLRVKLKLRIDDVLWHEGIIEGEDLSAYSIFHLEAREKKRDQDGSLKANKLERIRGFFDG